MPLVTVLHCVASTPLGQATMAVHIIVDVLGHPHEVAGGGVHSVLSVLAHPTVTVGLSRWTDRDPT